MLLRNMAITVVVAIVAPSIARAIAVSPDVLLMDEPCSALDPISTLAIEDLIAEDYISGRFG